MPPIQIRCSNTPLPHIYTDVTHTSPLVEVTSDIVGGNRMYYTHTTPQGGEGTQDVHFIMGVYLAYNWYSTGKFVTCGK